MGNSNKGNDAAQNFVDTHASGGAYLVEIVGRGYVSFTSREICNVEYGNGVGLRSAGLTNSGETYESLDAVQQRGIIDMYGPAFLNAHLRPEEGNDAQRQLLLDTAEENRPFSKDDIIVR